MGAHGVSWGKPSFDLDKLRGFKDGVVKRLTGGLTALAKQRKVTVVTGEAQFTSPNTLAIETADGRRIVRFAKAIIAAARSRSRRASSRRTSASGIQPARWIRLHPQAHAGARRRRHRAGDGDGLRFAGRRDHRHRDDGPADARRRQGHRRAVRQARGEALREDPAEDQGDQGRGASDDALHVSWEGEAGAGQSEFDAMLVSVGRRPNGKAIGAEHAGVEVDARGFIAVDKQMRTNVSHIFAIGDIVGQPMLAHKATHEGKVAAEVASGHRSAFDAK